MGTIPISGREEQQIERLRRRLRIPTKSGLIRAALRTLEEKTEEEQLRREIQESVRCCGIADKSENQALFRQLAHGVHSKT